MAEEWYRRWWHSDIGLFQQFARLIKTLIVAEFYELPAIKSELEYHPEQWIAKVAKRRIDSYGEEIRRKEAEVNRPDPLILNRAASEPVGAQAERESVKISA